MLEQTVRFTSLIRTLLRPERNFWWLMLIYGVAVSILGLSVPLSVQVLISSVVNAALINQVVILSAILFVVLSLSAFFIAVQNYLMELFERRYFARVMSEVALRLLHAAQSSLRYTNRADLVNRYFDIMSVQKSLPPLLTGGLATALQSIAGLVLTSFYHPAFLVFNAVTVLSIYLAYRIFDRPAGRTAIALSTAKYDAASWLEEIARSSTFFQTERGMEYAISRTEDLRDQYIQQHRRHFHYTFAQAVGLLIVYAVATATLLGLGGWLVIGGQLTIGQLVAAELVLVGVFYNLTRGIYYLELYYDLYAALTKLTQLISIEPEKLSEGEDGRHWTASIKFDNAKIVTERGTLRFDFSLAAGSTAMFVARSSFQESLVADLLRGYASLSSGQILLGEHDVDDFNATSLRDQVFMVDNTPLPICSIETFLRIAKPGMSKAEMRSLLEAVGLNVDQPGIASSLEQTLTPEGYPLTPVGVLKLKIAYALASSPKILVLSSQFDTFSQEARLKIIRNLKARQEMTVICFTHRQDLADFDNFYFCDYTDQPQFDNAAAVLAAYTKDVAKVTDLVNAKGSAPDD
ncbi:MAG: ABC transporter transmembrane domain-containing protein [Gammaproteobacteria bacterium]